MLHCKISKFPQNKKNSMQLTGVRMLRAHALSTLWMSMCHMNMRLPPGLSRNADKTLSTCNWLLTTRRPGGSHRSLEPGEQECAAEGREKEREREREGATASSTQSWCRIARPRESKSDTVGTRLCLWRDHEMTRPSPLGCNAGSRGGIVDTCFFGAQLTPQTDSLGSVASGAHNSTRPRLGFCIPLVR